MASALPPPELRTGRFDSRRLWSDDGFLVEAFGPGWALLSDPGTREAWVLEGVVHWDEDGTVDDGDRVALATCWGTSWQPN